MKSTARLGDRGAPPSPWHVRVRVSVSGRSWYKSPVSASSQDERLLRRAFEVARRAQAHGNHPFGALLVGPGGEVLLERENGFLPDHDRTGHAERLLAGDAGRAHPLELLARCTLYSSAEPCAMCAGAIYWAGIGRVVYGLSERRLRELTGDHPENPTLDLPCRIVFAAGQRGTEVVGPLLEDEGAALHEGFWKRTSP